MIVGASCQLIIAGASDFFFGDMLALDKRREKYYLQNQLRRHEISRWGKGGAADHPSATARRDL